MLEKFLDFIRQNELLADGSRVLLGVSGGVDSMVMASLFLRSGYRFSIGHCNFGLRGEESDGDENFVKDFAKENQIEFFSTRFDTSGYASEHCISIQMAARELRMEWMAGLCLREGFDSIALAHHRDDEAETFFINLLRGTGIAGLHGIRPRTGKIIRPMLFLGRKEILHYANKNQIGFREDSSNSKLDYTRNKIRHVILPELEKIKPGFSSILGKDIARIRSVESIYRKYLEKTWKDISEQDGDEIKINIGKLNRLPEPGTHLYEFIQAYGFNSSDAEQIMLALDNQAGKSFESPTHRLIRDREFLLVREKKDEDKMPVNCFYLDGPGSILAPLPIDLRISKRMPGYSVSTDRNKAHFDADAVKFPIVVRKWQEGDSFYPLGMKGKKLVSDFFTDMKFTGFQKQDAWVLSSGNEIIWILGYRIDERFKVTDLTERILEILVRIGN